MLLHYAHSSNIFRCNGAVNHCIIYATERGYGFADPYNIYENLKHLVLHYAQNSLEEHNESLNTTLTYPAFASPAAIAQLQTQQRLILAQNQNQMALVAANMRQGGWKLQYINDIINQCSFRWN